MPVTTRAQRCRADPVTAGAADSVATEFDQLALSENFRRRVVDALPDDASIRKVHRACMAAEGSWHDLSMSDGLLYFNDKSGPRLCAPDALFRTSVTPHTTIAFTAV
jgi:hypothetical protein